MFGVWSLGQLASAGAWHCMAGTVIRSMSTACTNDSKLICYHDTWRKLGRYKESVQSASVACTYYYTTRFVTYSIHACGSSIFHASYNHYMQL